VGDRREAFVDTPTAEALPDRHQFRGFPEHSGAVGCQEPEAGGHALRSYFSLGHKRKDIAAL